MPLHLRQIADLIVIGGGAAGFMSAIVAAEQGVRSVVLLEATSKPLEKVRISGGGRCNVTNACWNPRDLVINYPRGKNTLLGSFSRFAAGDAVSWFAENGLDLVVEADGRMFPKSNSSSEVIQCLRTTANKLGVHVHKSHMVDKIDILEPKKIFQVNCRGGYKLSAKKIVLATGANPSGRKIASSLGHKIVPPVPSLFSFSLDAPSLKSCAGIALENIHLKLFINGKCFEEKGSILLTHWGLSGPAVLKVSAFSARVLNHNKYKGSLIVNWIGSDTEELKNLFRDFRYIAARSSIASTKPFKDLPKRLWLALLHQAKINPRIRWAEFNSQYERNLIQSLISSDYPVLARGPFGEEFVTAGGITLEEVNLLTMESRLVPGLYFAGEVLDVDGVTGGFNFQHCWTSGWLAGTAIAKSFL